LLVLCVLGKSYGFSSGSFSFTNLDLANATNHTRTRYAAAKNTTQKIMSEDNLYLLLCYLILGITLLFLTLRNKYKLKTAVINLIITAIYSGIFFYNLNFNSSGGGALVWLMLLIFSIGLHWFVNFIGLLLTFKKNKQK
jgi:amino acid transporter